MWCVCALEGLCQSVTHSHDEEEKKLIQYLSFRKRKKKIMQMKGRGNTSLSPFQYPDADPAC